MSPSTLISAFMATFGEITVGDEQRTEFPTLSRTMFVKYAGASGDFNPMHHDDTIATQVGQPVGVRPRDADDGLAARVVKDWFGPEAIRKFQVRFSKQVWPGDMLTCTAVVTGKREDGGEQARRPRRDRRQPERRQGDHRRGHCRRRLTRWACSTVGSRSSPVRVAASGASSRCASRARARSVVVNDVGVSLDGRGTEEDPAAQVCKEIEALGGARRARTTTRSPTSTAPRSIVADRGRRVRHGRHPREQRGHRPRPDAAQDGRVRLRRRRRRAHEGHVQLHAARGRGHEGQGLRPDHQHHVVGRAARQLRADELRRGQGRHHGHDVRVVDGARPLRHHRERGGTVRRHAHDRRAVRALGPGAAARGEPGAERTAASRSSRRSRPAHVNGQILGRTEYSYTLFQHPKQIAWMWKDGGWTPAEVAADVRQGPRPAPAARRHGHAQVDGAQAVGASATSRVAQRDGRSGSSTSSTRHAAT